MRPLGRTLTGIGALLLAVGFILQVVGPRLLDWSATSVGSDAALGGLVGMFTTLAMTVFSPHAGSTLLFLGIACTVTASRA